MPPRLPARYRLNIRLGSDGDIEEWLAKDDSLDRPVLIRYLAPESSSSRQGEFLAAVQAAAGLTEIHLQRVFAAARTAASAYSVSEWDGGVTIEDRIRAGEALPVAEFLPNASGLCLALSRFHAMGGVHGAIDTTAVHYSAAHPVKLGAFGREPRWTDQADDTKALAEVLRAAITGTHDPSVMPSTVVTGMHPDVDTALKEGIDGTLDASSLAYALAATIYVAPEEPEPLRPWKSLALFVLIVVLIAGLAAIGLAADFDPDSPFLFPVAGEAPIPTVASPPITVEPEESDALTATAAVYDPLGDGTESDESVGNATDGTRSSSWSTEAYSRPIRDIKDGVGLIIDVDGAPGAVFVTGTAGTTFLIGWSSTIPDDPAQWEHIGRGTLQTAPVRMQLPVRGDGFWRLWLTDLPEQSDGSYRSEIFDIAFTS
jgi:serine/threonine protein kinase